jgi:hypothetical protein
MRYLPLVLATLLLSACGEPAGEPPAPQDPRSQMDEVPASNFVFLRGDDTVAVERYTRGERALEGERIQYADSLRLHYRATLGVESRVTSLELDSYVLGEDQRRSRVILNVVGDSLIAEHHEGGSMRRETLTVPPRTNPHLAGSLGMLEQLVHHAGQLEGDEELSVFTITAEGETELTSATVTRIGADSVAIAVAGGRELRLGVDGEGRLSGGADLPLGLRVERATPRRQDP